MKDIKTYINESINESFGNKFRNMVNKFLHPFSKTCDLPYIAIQNGNCFAPYGKIEYTLEDINDRLEKCQKYLNEHYGALITTNKRKRRMQNDIDTGLIFEFANCEDEEVVDIFKDITDHLSIEFESLFNEPTSRLTLHKVKKEMYTSADNVCVNEFTFEIEVRDRNGKFMNYIYPGAMLVTYDNIKVFNT